MSRELSRATARGSHVRVSRDARAPQPGCPVCCDLCVLVVAMRERYRGGCTIATTTRGRAPRVFDFVSTLPGPRSVQRSVDRSLTSVFTSRPDRTAAHSHMHLHTNLKSKTPLPHSMHAPWHAPEPSDSVDRSDSLHTPPETLGRLTVDPRVTTRHEHAAGELELRSAREWFAAHPREGWPRLTMALHSTPIDTERGICGLDVGWRVFQCTRDQSFHASPPSL